MADYGEKMFGDNKQHNPEVSTDYMEEMFGNNANSTSDGTAMETTKTSSSGNLEDKGKEVIDKLDKKGPFFSRSIPGLKILFSTELDESDKLSIIGLLNSIIQSKNDNALLKHLTSLESISLKYKKEKEDTTQDAIVQKDGLSQDVLDAPEIKNSQTFILDLLKSKNGWKNRIASSFDKVEKLNNKEIVDEIKGTSVLFDVEPEDWDIYFEKKGIPPKEQNQFKKYFYNMQGKKAAWYNPISKNGHDFGNFSFVNDFGDNISEDAERILNLTDGESITISIPDLIPSDGRLQFKTKKEALLYLYYSKLLYKEVGTFFKDIEKGFINSGEGIGGLISFIGNHPGDIFSAVLIYMGLATSGTIFRKINVWVLDKSSGRMGFGEYLNPVIMGGDEGGSNIEGAELKRREELIKSLREEFAGNNKKLDLIDNLEEKYLHILDHNVDLDKHMKKELREIEKEIFSIKKDIKDGSVTKKEAKEILKILEKDKRILRGKMFRLYQGSFDAQIAYVRGTKNKYFDTVGKLFLLSTESQSKSITKRRAEFKEKISNSLFKIRNGEILGHNKFLQGLEKYIEYSHRIPNDVEGDLKEKFDLYIEKLTKGEYKLPAGITNKNYEKAIQNQILKDLKKLGFDIENNFMDKVHKFKDAKSYIGGNKIKDLNKKLLLEYSSYDDNIKHQLNLFYDEILREGGNKYELKTAIDIVSRILNGKSMDEATKESFSIKAALIEKIKVVGNSLRESAISQSNSIIELNESTKITDIDRSSTSTNPNNDDDGIEKGTKEKIQEDKLIKKEAKEFLKEAKKFKNIYDISMKNNEILITFVGLTNGTDDIVASRQVVIKNLKGFLDSKDLIRNFGNKDKLILSDSSPLYKELNKIKGIEIKEVIEGEKKGILDKMSRARRKVTEKQHIGKEIDDKIRIAEELLQSNPNDEKIKKNILSLYDEKLKMMDPERYYLKIIEVLNRDGKLKLSDEMIDNLVNELKRLNERTIVVSVEAPDKILKKYNKMFITDLSDKTFFNIDKTITLDNFSQIARQVKRAINIKAISAVFDSINKIKIRR